ncbi:MAG: hypothetical protein OXI77_01290 [Chloroflexota bacterium]|nr:hypothetical protein [Chloroflexota bacterium]MDE2908769.1 hypothetical protein [Chloroflexota bacterium]
MCEFKLATVDVFAAMCVIVPIAFVFHALIWEVGKIRRPDQSGAELSRRRLFWCFVAVALMMLAGQFQNACETLEWQIVFLMICSVGLWEAIFFMLEPPERKPRKTDKGHAQYANIVRHQGAHPKPQGRRWVK